MSDEWDEMGGGGEHADTHHEEVEPHAEPVERHEPTARARPVEIAAAPRNNKKMYLIVSGVALMIMGTIGYVKYVQFQQGVQAQKQQQFMQQQAAHEQQLQKEREAAAKKDQDAVVAIAPGPDGVPPAAAGDQIVSVVGGTAVGGQPVAGTVPGAPVSAQESSGTVVQKPAAVGVGAAAPAPSVPVAAIGGQPQPANVSAPTPAPIVGQGSAAAIPVRSPASAVAVVQPAQPQPVAAAAPVSSEGCGREPELVVRNGELRLEHQLCSGASVSGLCAAVWAQRPAESSRASVAPGEKVVVARRAPKQRAIATSDGADGKTLLFVGGEEGEVVQPDLPERHTSARARAVVERAAQDSGLTGLTILQDRVLFRDHSGRTKEVVVGDFIDGVGKLEAIDFEQKQFRAGGKVYD